MPRSTLATDALVHEVGVCFHGGSPIGPTGSRQNGEICISLDDRMCSCDPRGDKARAAAIRHQKYRRAHVLEQDEVWFNKAGEEIRLEDMSNRYLRNVMNFLEQRAGYFHTRECLWICAAAAMPHGDGAQDALDQVAEEVMDMLPTTWLYRQPLLVRLEALVRSGHDGPID